MKIKAMEKKQIIYNCELSCAYVVPDTILFIDKFGVYPSMLEAQAYFNIEELLKWLKSTYRIERGDITASYFKDKEGKYRIQDGIFTLQSGMMLSIQVSGDQVEREVPEYDYEESMFRSKKIHKAAADHFKVTMYLYYDNICINQSTATHLIDQLYKFKVEPKRKSELKFLCVEEGELTLKSLEIKAPEIDIALNYGSQFSELYDYICNKMVGEKNLNKGLILFHGTPGSGKTFLCRKLINDLSDKKQVIYIPPDMVYELSSPKFLPFLMANQNSILVIEDGENVIKSRKGGQNQAVSNLLNAADGLLSDALNIQIICTFNCNLNDIDEALLRKGRLIAKHEFKALTKEDAQKLLDHLKIDFKAIEDMTLADIYNYSDKGFTEERKSVGF